LGDVGTSFLVEGIKAFRESKATLRFMQEV